MSRFAREVEDVTPNLIPIMNLFTALIPFLLMASVFYEISLIQITVPVASESGETDNSKEEDKVTLSVQILEDKFMLSASSDTLDPAILKAMNTTVMRQKDADVAYEELSKAAHKIKGDSTLSDTAMIAPDDDVTYDIVVRVMDAVRRIKLDDNRVRLFGRVVLTSKVK